uniref:Uncharacterized protein n=1 Tax=Timema cristinae TaxID=61476 RepID=A0A7R9DSW4_TIMCR|nr:unnamed protein product [Timema cristinae]
MCFYLAEGPIVHDQPTYASVPGIRVYGMVCVPKRSRRSLILGRKTRELKFYCQLATQTPNPLLRDAIKSSVILHPSSHGGYIARTSIESGQVLARNTNKMQVMSGPCKEH